MSSVFKQFQTQMFHNIINPIVHTIKANSLTLLWSFAKIVSSVLYEARPALVLPANVNVQPCRSPCPRRSPCASVFLCWNTWRYLSCTIQSCVPAGTIAYSRRPLEAASGSMGRSEVASWIHNPTTVVTGRPRPGMACGYIQVVMSRGNAPHSGWLSAIQSWNKPRAHRGKGYWQDQPLVIVLCSERLATSCNDGLLVASQVRRELTQKATKRSRGLRNITWI